jgi:hypothetical protein
MNTLTIILLIYFIIDIISTIIALLLMRRKGIGFRDLANRLRWLCKKEEPITEDEDEDWYEYDDYDFIRNADENDVDDQGYGY